MKDGDSIGLQWNSIWFLTRIRPWFFQKVIDQRRGRGAKKGSKGILSGTCCRYCASLKEPSWTCRFSCFLHWPGRGNVLFQSKEDPLMQVQQTSPALALPCEHIVRLEKMEKTLWTFKMHFIYAYILRYIDIWVLLLKGRIMAKRPKPFQLKSSSSSSSFPHHHFVSSFSFSSSFYSSHLHLIHLPLIHLHVRHAAWCLKLVVQLYCPLFSVFKFWWWDLVGVETNGLETYTT